MTDWLCQVVHDFQGDDLATRVARVTRLYNVSLSRTCGAKKDGRCELYEFVLHALAESRRNDRFRSFDGFNSPGSGS